MMIIINTLQDNSRNRKLIYILFISGMKLDTTEYITVFVDLLTSNAITGKALNIIANTLVNKLVDSVSPWAKKATDVIECAHEISMCLFFLNVFSHHTLCGRFGLSSSGQC